MVSSVKILKLLLLAALTITLPTGCGTIPRALGPGLASPVTSFAAETGAPAPANPQAEGPAEDSSTIKADGPFPVRMADVPTAEYDPNNQFATGTEEDRPESPITEEEADRLRAEALLLSPSPNVQGVTALAPGQLAPLPAGVSFDSLDANHCCGGGLNVPPDPQLAVGPNHIIAVVNVAFAIYDKTGTLLQGPITFSSFFAGTPGCSNTSVFDPNVLYDEAENRFVLGIDGDGSNYCVAATQAADPTGSWNRYGFATNVNGAFFDFPQAGVGREAIYVGSNQFLGSFFLEGRIFAMNKAALYAGSTMTVVSRSTGSSGSTPQPVNLHGFNQGIWPTGGPHYVMTELFDGANHTVWSWTDPFGANVFTNEGNVNLNNATGVTAGFPVDVPQAGSSDLVQANDWRGLDAEYHDGEIWMSTTIACNPGSGTVNCIRWARIDPTGPTVIDAGVFGSNGEYRFFPDLAVNSCGDMAVGYTKSGPSIFPSVWVTGREAGDPSGSLQPETMLKDGEVAYDSFQRPGPHRWGDYTEMTIDPDGHAFWYMGEYSKDITNFNPTKWGNFIGSFQFASCAGGNTPPSAIISSPADGASFPVGTSISFSGSAGDTEDGDLTPSLTWTSSLDGSIGSGGSFSAILSAGTHLITASVTDSGGLSGSDSITVTVANSNTPPTVTISSPGDGASFGEGTSIAFAATADDPESGDLTSLISWVSDRDGPIGTGGSFSAVLSVGTHVITASVTDSGGLSGSDSVTILVNPSGGTTGATFTSVGADDGLVVESTETSNEGGLTESNAGNVVALRVGDLNGNVQVKSFLSFDTSTLPEDATILSATLRLRRGIVRGTNPFDILGACLADVQTGAFSGNRATESSDFQAPATAVGVASLSNAVSDGDWSEGSLDPAGLAAINLAGLTQFRIYFTVDDNNDGSSDFIGYRSGNDSDAASRPQLVVTYSAGGTGNTAPTVSITSPADGSSFLVGSPISFAGTAGDAEDGNLTPSLTWTSSLSGPIGSGGSFSTSALLAGSQVITASVTDSGGLPGSDSITVTVTAPTNTPPTVSITSPADGSSFVVGSPISFAGTAGDAEDGDLTSSLAWTSSVSGTIGSGGSFSTSALLVGTQVITASVTDSGGLPGSDSITVTVNSGGDTPEEQTFTSIGADDGLVVETAENSDVGGLTDSTNSNVVALRVGDLNGDLQVKSFVSFDTSSIPAGATILSATLRLRRGILRGTDPFTTHGACLADVRTGAFNGNPALESGDFEAVADATAVVSLGDAAANGDWSEGELDAAGLAALNRSGLTQFRIYFSLDDNDDGSSDFIGYRSGDDADASSRPQLVVVYLP